MNILVLTKRFTVGKDSILDDFGREVRLSHELHKQGHKVTIFSADYHKREHKNVKLHGMDARIRPYSIPRIPFFILEAAGLAKKADIIISMSDPMLGGIGYIISLMQGKPLVYDIRDNFETYETLKKPGVGFLNKNAIKRASLITTHSSILSRKVIAANKINPCKVKVLTNGVNTALFKPYDKARCRKKFGLPKNAAIISYMGASNRKGLEQIFEVFNEMRKKNKNLYLFLIGKFSHIKEEGIITHEPIPYEELPYAVGAVDVFVIPYEQSDFNEILYAPYKLVETMACNRPIVCTDIGEMKKLLTETPELVCKPNDKQGMKQAILKALEYKKVDYRKTLKEKGLTWELLGRKFSRMLSKVSS